MKNSKKSVVWTAALIGITLCLVSCEYEKYADADYPEQLIYMPAATYGNFVIDNIVLPVGSVPTTGTAYRYKVDTGSRKFIVPLGVYRSGVNCDGKFVVNITVNTDTITKLLAIPGKLPTGTVLLPSDKYTVASSVTMEEGKDVAAFDLSIDLDYFLSGYPSGIYAIGVGISSEARKTNPSYATTIVVIDTKMMKPTAEFSVSSPSAMERKFNNSSVMALSYEWNFGDGTAVSKEKSPVHTYAQAGTYNVTLTALGITGTEHQSVKTFPVTVQ